MAYQVLDVLQQEGRRLLLGDDPLHIEEKRALGGALESVRAPERVLLRHAGQAERLAGEARKEDVVVRDVGCIDLRDVAGDPVVFAEVLDVCLLRVSIPFTREYAAAAGLLEPDPDASDPREQVNEGEVGRAFRPRRG